MDFYYKNLEMLKTASSEFHDMIKKGIPKYPIKINTISGEKNFIAMSHDCRCFINSAYNIENEMQRMFENIDKDVGVLIVFGAGAGYVFKHVQENYKNITRFILVEPSLDIMRHVLNKYDLKKLNKKFKKFEMIVNETEEGVAGYIENISSNNVSQKVAFVVHTSYRSLFREYYNKVSEKTVDYLRSVKMNAMVGDRNTYKVIANTLKNIQVESSSVINLFEFYSGKPAIIVSAGPSLNKNMEFLKEVNDKALIFAVGTSIKILESNGIKPHFRVAFTPHELEMDIFRNLKDDSIPFIHTDMLYYEVCQNYKGPKFRMISESNKLARHIYTEAEIDQLYVITELTVANTTFEILCRAGSSEIILIGQDMAFTGNTNYAKGAVNNFDIRGSEEFVLKEKDIYGNEVYTKHAFLAIRSAFERAINRYSTFGIQFYNATEGGLNIKGAENVKLKDKLEQLENLESLKAQIDNIVQNRTFENNMGKVVNVVKRIQSQIDEIEQINQERIERLKELVEYRERGKSANEVLKEYVNINDYENRLKEISFYNSVAQKDLDSIFNTAFKAYRYDGQIQSKQLDATENILIRVSIEVQKYCGIVKGLVNEFFEDIEKKEKQPTTAVLADMMS